MIICLEWRLHTNSYWCFYISLGEQYGVARWDYPIQTLYHTQSCLLMPCPFWDLEISIFIANFIAFFVMQEEVALLVESRQIGFSLKFLSVFSNILNFWLQFLGFYAFHLPPWWCCPASKLFTNSIHCIKKSTFDLVISNIQCFPLLTERFWIFFIFLSISTSTIPTILAMHASTILLLLLPLQISTVFLGNITGLPIFFWDRSTLKVL